MLYEKGFAKNVSVSAQDYFEIVELVNRGGELLYLAISTNSNKIKIVIEIDGNTIDFPTIEELYSYIRATTLKDFIYVSVYDAGTPFYSVRLVNPLAFEKKLRIQVFNDDTSAKTIHYFYLLKKK